MEPFQKIFAYIVDLVFPKTCAGCSVHGTFLCERCESSIPRATETAHSFVTARFSYKNKAIRTLIWRFKYRNGYEIARCFSAALYEEILGHLGERLSVSKAHTFLILPVPLHPKRLRERGYNQSELLVREILKHDTGNILKYEHKALVRIRETKQQAQSDKRETRLENLRGAFVASPHIVKKKNILLIDDVTTTGATLCEARKALLKTGATSVTAFTIAH